MLELEEAGVSVEPDAFGPRGETEAAPRFTLAMPDPGLPPALDRAARGEAPDDGAATPRSAEAPVGGKAGDEGVGRVVLLAGIVVVLAIGAMLLL